MEVILLYNIHTHIHVYKYTHITDTHTHVYNPLYLYNSQKS